MSQTADIVRDKARQLLAARTSGPNGMLAYMFANAVISQHLTTADGQAFMTRLPFMDRKSDAAPDIYYSVVLTNRTGLEVATPPGGTQDMLVTLDGHIHHLELGKPKLLADFIAATLGVPASPEIDDLDAVAKILAAPGVTDVRLETPLEAAIHETAEEHGWNYVAEKGKILSLTERQEEIFSKRSFDTDPPLPVRQTLFLAHVSDFNGVTLVRNEKIEAKIKSRLGKAFYEHGDFMTLRHLQKQFAAAQAAYDADPSAYDKNGAAEIAAARSRLEMITRIENAIAPRA